MNIVHIHTISDELDNIPVVDGQIIVLDDASCIYYDMNGIRHNASGSGGVIVDDAISSTSRNPVQNRVIYSALQDKANSSDLGTAAAKDSTNTVTEDSTDLIESGAVYDALLEKVNSSDLAAVATSGQYADLSGNPTLGTAAAKDVPASGDASSTEVVLGNDSRLSNSRPASDVYPWAKEPTKPAYTASEVGAVATTANQGLTSQEQLNARTNIGAGTSNFDGAYNSLSGKPTLGTAAAKDVPSSGDASTAQVVMGNDSRLTNARNAADVYAWAKAATKPSYTASEVGAIASTLKGASNGVAELDANGKVPSGQLPSYVDDVLEYASQSAFPATGETGKIYIAQDTNKTYRWSGSAYVEISASLALGETSSTAYRGDRGKTAYDHSQLTSGNPHGVTKSDVGLGNVGNFKAVSTVASQGLTDTEKSNARANIGAGTGNSNLALGETSSTAYRGDRGKTAYDHSQITSGNPHNVTKSDVGLGNVGNFKAVSTVANQGLTDTEKANARANIGAGTSSFSGSYTDLTNKPTIPTVNNATLTIQKNGTNVQTFTANQASNATANITVPTKTSELTNDSGFITSAAIAVTGVKGNSESSYRTGNINITAANIGLGNVGNFKAVSTVASQGLSDTEKANARANIGAGTSNFSGNYNDLTNKPTIPTVNNATLTIQKNGSNVQTFTANQSSNATANITVPTKVSELTNDSGYTKNTGTVTSVKVGSTAYNPTSGVVSLPAYPTNTDTHRPINVNGTQTLGNNTTALNLKNGSNVTITGSGGDVTIAATNTWRGIQNNLTSDSTTDSLSAAQGKALANGSARDSTKLPAIIGYYGSDTANTNGWYKVCTISQSGYSDFAVNLLFTQGYGRQATGLLHVHTRCNNGTAIDLQTLKWMYRYGFNAGDVKLVTGNNTWSLYVQQTIAQHGRIQVQVLSKMGTSGDTTFTLTSNTTKESATPGGTAATDGGTVAYANNAGTVNGKTVAVNVPADAKFTDTKYTASTTSIGSASAGTAIAADDITAWNAGSAPTLGTAIAADDITAWSAGTAASSSCSGGILTINNGTAPSLSYTARSIPNVTSVGSVPSLSYTARSIPNISVTSKTVVTGITAS